MRHFSYFLFENFDAEKEANNPKNPRCLFDESTDVLLSFVAEFPPSSCLYSSCCHHFGRTAVQALMEAGVLRLEGDTLMLDAPIFLREDAPELHRALAGRARHLADALETALPELEHCCTGLCNGFSVKENLYHILCGKIFDGLFFEHLSRAHAVSTSRLHPSGLDYLTVVYENCGELHHFSDRLLCSYNRFAGDRCALQSFGDGDGERLDLYRFFRLRERGKLPDAFCEAEKLLGTLKSEDILSGAESLHHSGCCRPDVLALLTFFGYAEGGQLCVPVYTSGQIPIILEMETLVEAHLGSAFSTALSLLSRSLNITASRHGVSPPEISNELYHLLFGSLNEELVSRGYVAQPSYRPGEGRYLKSFEFFD